MDQPSEPTPAVTGDPGRTGVGVGPDDPERVGREPMKLGYRPELDGLRAVSILLIFVAHISYPWPSLGPNFMPGSFEAVDLFFILSGFLLTKLLFEERAKTGGFSFRGFYRRRALRLLPALIFMLIVLIPVTIQQGHHLPTFLMAELYALFYVTNWAIVIGADGTIPFQFSHMWTLAIEEQYYLVFFPLLIGLLALFKSLRTVGWVLVGLMVLVWVDRFISAQFVSPGDFETTLYVRSDTRADALLIGPLLAVWLQLGHRITPRIRLLAIPATAFLVWMVLYAGINDKWVYEWGFGLIDISWGLVLIGVLGGTHVFTRILQLRPIVWTGKVSYGLYLWHMPVFVEVFRHTRYREYLPNWLPFVLAVVATYCVAGFSYYVIERPFLRRKRPRGSVVETPPVHADAAPGGPAPSVAPPPG